MIRKGELDELDEDAEYFSMSFVLLPVGRSIFRLITGVLMELMTSASAPSGACD